MRVLAINHYFKHDLDSLIYSSGGKHEIKEISPLYFHERSKKALPVSFYFTNGLEDYTRPEHKKYRQKWISELRRAIYELYTIFPFDVVISPSYVFFYIYDLKDVLSDLGIPFFVVQKETTRPPSFIERESKVAAELFPYKADFMTVCGNDQVKFSIAAGVPKNRFEVTGQPRFDFYRQPERWKSKKELGIPEYPGKKIISFLTYYLDCAIPPSAPYYSSTLWKNLRDETEEVLINIAHTDEFIILIKPHPQQPPYDISEMIERFKSSIADKWGKSVIMLKPEDDARNILVHSDIVVGFQTTALLEAIAAGKRTIYTFWTETVSKLAEEMLPYHEYEPLLNIARSKEQLRNLILNSNHNEMNGVDLRGTELFEECLGPLDGKASFRVWEIIQREVKKVDLNSEHIALRKKLLSRRTTYCKHEINITNIKMLLLLSLAGLFYFFKNINFCKGYYDTVHRMIDIHQKRINECTTIVNGNEIRDSVLVGRYNENWMFRIKVLFYKLRKKTKILKIGFFRKMKPFEQL